MRIIAFRDDWEFWGKAKPTPVYSIGGCVYIYSMDGCMCVCVCVCFCVGSGILQLTEGRGLSDWLD